MLNYFFQRVGSRLMMGKTFMAGRNFQGRICVQGRGAGNKRI
jgi:hypothetical protein